jgi:hypothetical protein
VAAVWPAPSQSAENVAVMAAIDRQAPAGAVLASEWISERMPVYYPNRPQLVTFVQVAFHYGTWSGNWGVALPLVKAMSYLRAGEAPDREAFVQVVTAQRPAAVVFRQRVAIPSVRCTMAALGYRPAPLPGSDFALFVRSEAPVRGADC